MRDCLHKSASVFLALLVLTSTLSFNVAKHYCGEHLIDVAFFGEAEPCAMETALTAKYGPEHTKKSDCCKDEQTLVKGQDELKAHFDQITIENIVFLNVFTTTYNNLFTDLERHFVPFDGYPPPLLTTNYQTLYEQFLI